MRPLLSHNRQDGAGSLTARQVVDHFEKPAAN
jgi:hypothetical protein